MEPMSQQNSTNDWFNSLPTPATEPPKKKPLKLIVLAVLLLILAGSVAAALIVNTKRPQCLTTDDLKELLGRTDVDTVSSASDFFFNYQVEFEANSTAYATDTESTGPEIIQQVSAFYTKHPDKSITFTLASDYFDDSGATLAKQRIDTIRTDLSGSGISSNHIASKEPAKNDRENKAEEATTASIAITSISTCK